MAKGCYCQGVLPFEKPTTEVYIFKRATLSSLAMKEYTSKEDLSTKKQAFLLKAKC